ncbi:MAG: metallophosphoesterase [Gammaproteobacteria bacterium]|nr:metallophosphoesterase [Gammaproteobacteria bacterium]
MSTFKRRDFLKLAGIGGVVFASRLSGFSFAAQSSPPEEFYFVQLSDTHWGFNDPKINPDAEGTLKKAVDIVNALEHQPDFIVFTGDLTHSTDDPKLRRTRLREFRDIVGHLKVKDVRFMPGEHDAALDNGEAYQEFFGQTHYTFDNKGIHFIALDNVSDPKAQLGTEQLKWLAADLQQLKPDAPIVVLTHRPLFELYPQWDWATRDGAEALSLLAAFKHVSVFYGHIHQQHHHQTGHIQHHAAKSLIFPLPAPGSAPKRAPIPWNESAPYQGMGLRSVAAEVQKPSYTLDEINLTPKQPS